MTIATSGILLAASFFHFSAPKGLPQTKRPVPNKGDCVDFSGTWKGTCVDSNVEHRNSNLVIDQTRCVSASFDGTDVPFGGVANFGQTSPGSAVWQGQGYLDWDASLSIMHLRRNFSYRVLNQDVFSNLRGTVDYSLVNGQLIEKSADTNESEYSGRVTTEKSWEECTYDKVPAQP